MPLIEINSPVQNADGQTNSRNHSSSSRRPILSPRLMMVTDLLPAGKRLIDIGTDHAYLPISAVVEGRFLEAIAADVRPGPIKVAERNIRRFGCEGKVRAVLSDGMTEFSRQAGDVVAIAGLGGLEMIDILDKSPEVWNLLVLQPQKSAAELRHHLALKGYAIRQESLILEDRRLYLGLLAEYAPSEAIDSQADHYIGPALLRDRPPLFEIYLEKQRIRVMHALRRQADLINVLTKIDELLMTIKNNDLKVIQEQPVNSREREQR